MDPYLWCLAWFFSLGCILFFVYWVFAWGISNGGTTLESWGIVFALSMINSFLIAIPMKVLLIHIFAIEAMRPQLRVIHKTILMVAQTATSADSPPDVEFRVVQHMSASCRASRDSVCHNLSSAQILRHMDDIDVENCRENRSTRIGYFAATLLIFPAIVVLYGDAGDNAIEVALSGLITGIYIVSYKLYEKGIAYLVIPYLMLFLFITYKFLEHRHNKRKAKKDTSNYKRGLFLKNKKSKWNVAKRLNFFPFSY
jgi:hypothetical protein